MLRKRSRPVTGSSSSSKNSAADHNHGENNTNFLLPPHSQLPPPPSPSPPDKKSIKLLPTSLFFFNSSKLFSNLFFTTADSNSIAETETPPPQPGIMNHPPSSRFDAHQTFFAPPPPPTSHLGCGANSSVLTDKQQQKLNPTRISSSVTTNTKQHSRDHHHHFWEKSNPERGVGLVALIDETLNYNNHHNYYTANSPPPPPYSSSASTKQQKTKLVVFGSQLKIQIPPSLPQFLPSNPSPTSSSSCCNSPGEFGIKTPRSNLFTNSRNGPQKNLDDGLVRTPESISIEEIELSEDYTCVITHGPNPKTTRIFGNCILESCCGGGGNEMGGGFCSKRNEDAEGFSNWSEKIPVASPQKMEVESFLSFCHHCKKKIGEGNDIYMYRGEKAFCSQECRCQGMLFEEVEA